MHGIAIIGGEKIRFERTPFIHFYCRKIINVNSYHSIQLVSGNQEAWINLAKESRCWYEFLPGFLFYTEPGCKYFELGTYAGVWLRRWESAKGFRDSRTMNHLDRVVLKVMENDMHQVIHDIQVMCDNKWFVTHLTDLLCHCGQLQILGDQQME